MTVLIASLMGTNYTARYDINLTVMLRTKHLKPWMLEIIDA